MKTEPRDIDREAARLFVLEDHMRFHDGRRWIRTTNPVGCCYTGLDMDDPATVGICLAQMLDKARATGIRPDFGVSGVNSPGSGCGRLSFWLDFSADTYEARVTPPTEGQSMAAKASIGAAVVAAMRGMKVAA